jgi:hypothetical protein
VYLYIYRKYISLPFGQCYPGGNMKRKKRKKETYDQIEEKIFKKINRRIQRKMKLK